MGKINILPSSVYNRIAAGEVIERPYSVVKELVENAIDAGATEIEIDVEEGGKSLIRVLDNGTGILREDLPSVFLPHATSKLSKAEDLENILTLGFRGEAVASIASVSELTVKTRTAGAKCYSLSAVGGTLGEIEETSENTFSVSGVPADLTNIDMAAFFGEIVAEADGYRGIRLEELLRDKLATAACKAAVKGGENLSQAEIDELFRLIDGNLGLRCPHGRPVVARIGKTELEKLFKRVV